MSTVPIVFSNPFDWTTAWFREYGARCEAFCQNWINLLGRVGNATTYSPQDVALDRINRMQILLYRGYVKRQKLKALHHKDREVRRFIHWMSRYSGDFRKLLNVYPEWLSQFEDSAHGRAKLMRTIAFHLYQ